MTTTPRTWKSEELPQVFRDCCHAERGRYCMDQPFQRGEFICATDGRICIRMKGTLDAPPIDGTTPPTEDLYGREERPNSVVIPAEFRCTPWRYETCVKCGGDGKCICDSCDCEHSCGACQGEGEFKLQDIWQLFPGDLSPFIGSAYLDKIVTASLHHQIELRVHYSKPRSPMLVLFPETADRPQMELLLMGMDRERITAKGETPVGIVCP